MAQRKNTQPRRAQIDPEPLNILRHADTVIRYAILRQIQPYRPAVRGLLRSAAMLLDEVEDVKNLLSLEFVKKAQKRNRGMT